MSFSLKLREELIYPTVFEFSVEIAGLAPPVSLVEIFIGGDILQRKYL